jgi:hypothetical protein
VLMLRQGPVPFGRCGGVDAGQARSERLGVLPGAAEWHIVDAASIRVIARGRR